MSIPLNRSNIYRYLMNIVVEVERLPEDADGAEPQYFGKVGAKELALQLIEEFGLAPEKPQKPRS